MRTALRRADVDSPDASSPSPALKLSLEKTSQLSQLTALKRRRDQLHRQELDTPDLRAVKRSPLQRPRKLLLGVPEPEDGFPDLQEVERLVYCTRVSVGEAIPEGRDLLIEDAHSHDQRLPASVANGGIDRRDAVRELVLSVHINARGVPPTIGWPC